MRKLPPAAQRYVIIETERIFEEVRHDMLEQLMYGPYEPWWAWLERVRANVEKGERA
jgi:hypothetical protein